MIDPYLLSSCFDHSCLVETIYKLFVVDSLCNLIKVFITIMGNVNSNGPLVWTTKLEINGQAYRGIVAADAFEYDGKISFIPEKGPIAKILRQKLCESDNLYLHDGNQVKLLKKAIDLDVRPVNYIGHPMKEKFVVVPDCRTLIDHDFIIGKNVVKRFDIRFNENNKGSPPIQDDKISAVKRQVSRSCKFAITITLHKAFLGLRIEPEVFRLIEPFGNAFGEITPAGMKAEPMEIKILEKVEKPKVGYRKFPKNQYQSLNDTVAQLRALGVLEHCNATIKEHPYANFPILKEKKDGSMRLVLSARQLNAVTEKFEHPIPRLSKICAKMQGMMYFSCLDCTRGTYQVVLKESDRPKTAFWTPRGFHQYKKCPYGTKNTTSHFQAQMDKIFAAGLWKKCVIYIDDILVFGKSLEEHNKNLRWVLETCKANKIKLNLSKCRFASTQVEYCGFSFGPTIKPIMSKLESWTKGNLPTDEMELEQMLSRFRNYSMFLSDNQSMVRLRKLKGLLSKGGDPIKWTRQDIAAYKGILDTLLIKAKNRYDANFWRKYLND